MLTRKIPLKCVLPKAGVLFLILDEKTFLHSVFHRQV